MKPRDNKTKQSLIDDIGDMDFENIYSQEMRQKSERSHELKKDEESGAEINNIEQIGQALDNEEGTETLWDQFLNELQEKENSSQRVTCRIDSDLAYTLDECKINNSCRTDMINSILRCFIKQNLNRFAKFKTSKKTLLTP